MRFLILTFCAVILAGLTIQAAQAQSYSKQKYQQKTQRKAQQNLNNMNSQQHEQIMENALSLLNDPNFDVSAHATSPQQRNQARQGMQKWQGLSEQEKRFYLDQALKSLQQ